jgi:hypothetical protein
MLQKGEIFSILGKYVSYVFFESRHLLWFLKEFENFVGKIVRKNV